METEQFTINYKGLSRDYRTNEWSFKCKSCKKSFEPATTVMATQTVECPKCGKGELVNYNNLEV